MHLIFRQQNELCKPTNFYVFLQGLMNSRCKTDIVSKTKCQLLRMNNDCGCIKTKDTLNYLKKIKKMIEF